MFPWRLFFQVTRHKFSFHGELLLERWALQLVLFLEEDPPQSPLSMDSQTLTTIGVLCGLIGLLLLALILAFFRARARERDGTWGALSRRIGRVAWDVSCPSPRGLGRSPVRVPVLDRVRGSAESGSLCAIMGPSGCGKVSHCRGRRVFS